MGIINDNDMEIVVQGDQEEVLRRALKDRLFALIKMPARKPDRYISDFSSSVFVGRMQMSPAIRARGSGIPYEACEYYLAFYRGRGTDDERKHYFERHVKRIVFPGAQATRPTIEELLSFLQDKELVFLTNYVEGMDMEHIKVKHFQEDFLLLRKDCKDEWIMTDDYFDVRIYLSRIGNDFPASDPRLAPDDIRCFDFHRRLLGGLKKTGEKLYENDSDCCVEFVSRSDHIQAAYSVTRFHSNPLWDANPVNILTFRSSVFILPGALTPPEARRYPKARLARKTADGTDYVIDSIHVNSDICFDLREFANLVHRHYGSILME